MRVAEYKSSLDARKDEKAKAEENAGAIQFRSVKNDGTSDNMILLTGLKNLFQKQLPNMPKDYIARLVYDRNHRSLAIVKPGLIVVGGITYRLFISQHFAEIVFCAITSSEQVKGYGSYLMNKLKEHVKTEGDIRHFLTYADNYATGYFRKQGFKEDITLDKSIWVGFIKDYDGGTLMQCSMVPKVNYLQVFEIIEMEKKALFEIMKEKSKSHIIYAGIKKFKSNGKMAISDIPGVLDAGWTPEMSTLTEKQSKGKVYEFIRPLFTEIQNHQSAWPFLEPVNGDEVLDYYEVIKDPMDLKTMEERVEANYYKSIDQFSDDLYKIVENCRTYNHVSTQYYKCADKLEAFYNLRLKEKKDNMEM